MPYSPCRLLFVVCALAIPVFHPAAYAAGSPTKPNDRQIAQWIKELGDDDFAVREKASRQLWLAGEVAEASLEKALQSGDPEVARRAQAVLDKFRWGIYPDTPANVLALIKEYKAENPEEESFDDEIVNKMFASDLVGLRAVLQIAKNDRKSYRRDFFRNLASRQVLGYLHKMFDKVEDKNRCDWYVTLAYDGACLSQNDFAAYFLLRGQLDERIRAMRARLTRDASEKRCAYTLAYLYRVKGDFAEARKIAEKEGFDDLLYDILLRTTDWKALAARPKPMGLHPINQVCYRASFARLSGNRKQWEAAKADLEKRTHSQELYDAALTLIANDRPAEGIRLLADSEHKKHFAHLVLCKRLQYREAMTLMDRTSPDDLGWKDLEVQQARMWHYLGEQDRARKLATRLAERLREGREYKWGSQLLGLEHDIGLKDKALEHCAFLLTVPDPKKSWEPELRDYLWQLFPGKHGDVVWYEVLSRKFPQESILAVLRRVSDLFEGKIAKATVREWIEEAQRNLDTLKGEERSKRLIAFAEVAGIAGLDVLSRSLLEKADNYESLMQLGDLWAEKQEWMRAAECYRRAGRKGSAITDWNDRKDGSDPLSLYLAGDSLVKAGHEREGKRLIERAHFLPLGIAWIRRSLAEELGQRGHRRGERREFALLDSLAEAPSHEFNWLSYQRAHSADERKDYFQAAQAYQQTMFSDLSNVGVEFGLVGAVRITSEIHRLRACGFLSAGKIEEARREIDLALNAWPANVKIAIALVPQFERCGHKKEADALFARCLDPNEKVCRAYARCADSHNSVAWISACCRRNLDKALTHAEKAVELAPSNAGYLDTLAEVHFQRGDKDKAIAMQKRAIELDPKKVYYRKQLKRIEAGDPKAERPPENEE